MNFLTNGELLTGNKENHHSSKNETNKNTSKVINKTEHHKSKEVTKDELKKHNKDIAKSKGENHH